MVRTIEVSPYLTYSTGLAFGPEGALWVGNGAGTNVVAFDGLEETAGAVSHASIPAVEAVEFDTLGRFVVTSFTNADLVRLSLDGSSSTLLYDGTLGVTDLEIDRSGYLVISDRNSDIARWIEVDGTTWLSNSDSLSTLTPAVNPRGLAVERYHGLTVGDYDSPRLVFGTDWIGATPSELTIPASTNAIEDVDYGPDGRLFVATGYDKVVLAVDRDESATQTFAALPSAATYAMYLAFAPFRFDVRVKGRVTVSGGAVVDIDENAVLSLQPSGRKVCLLFTDDAFDSTDFVSLTGHDRFVAFGEPSAFEAPGSRRTMLARAPRSEDPIDDISVFCDWKRSVDTHGFERVTSAKGSLWFADAAQQVHVNFKTKTLRNP